MGEGDNEDLFANLEKQMLLRTCEAGYKCSGLGTGKWFLRFSCPGCADLGIPTADRKLLSVLCCVTCSDWMINTSIKTCSICSWTGVGYGRVAVVAQVHPDGEIVVGSDIAQVVKIMDSTPEYDLIEEDHDASEHRNEEEEEGEI